MMNTKIRNSILAGIIGTLIMTLVMLFTPIIGLPKMSPPEMLSTMIGIPIIVGWIMHFIIGIVFALFYTYVCLCKWKITNTYLKGVVFGIIVFIFAQVMMSVMALLIPMPSVNNALIPTLIASLIGHIVYGIAIAKTMENSI